MHNLFIHLSHIKTKTINTYGLAIFVMSQEITQSQSAQIARETSE